MALGSRKWQEKRVLRAEGAFYDPIPEYGSVARLARISHHLTVEARNRPAITALRLLAVLNVLFKYASARRAARALY